MQNKNDLWAMTQESLPSEQTAKTRDQTSKYLLSLKDNFSSDVRKNMLWPLTRYRLTETVLMMGLFICLGREITQFKIYHPVLP